MIQKENKVNSCQGNLSLLTSQLANLLFTVAEAEVCTKCQAAAVKWGERCVKRTCKQGSQAQYMETLQPLSSTCDSK